jgi:hypothetical protein
MYTPNIVSIFVNGYVGYTKALISLPNTHVRLYADGDDLLPGSGGETGHDRDGTLVFGHLHGFGQRFRFLPLHLLLAGCAFSPAGTWFQSKNALNYNYLLWTIYKHLRQCKMGTIIMKNHTAKWT